ncbi:peptide/nickel transport system permease protein [Candidatus Methanomarinus sp.]|nr:peptide/nickel transport system permease protein [ANME-2 cluster archaeon]
MKMNKSRFNNIIGHLKRSRSATIGTIIITLLVLAAIFAPILAPYDPIETNVDDRLMKPCIEHPLGTDHLGRDVYSRLLYGARISLTIGIVVVSISALIGIILGIYSGFYGGLIDSTIMRLVDAFLTFPSVFLAIVIAGVLQPGITSVMIALVVVGWTKYARVGRGSVLSLKEKEFVESAISLGVRDRYIMFRHIFPNIITPIIIVATLGMADAILSSASLSFLGFGPQPPAPEWGAMLNAGRPFMQTDPYLMIFPGLAIMILVLGFNLLGDGLRDILDPKKEIIE